MTDNFIRGVVALYETKSYEEANKYLKGGWVLLSTHLWDQGHPVERHQGTVYCLAWHKNNGAPRHPEID